MLQQQYFNSKLTKNQIDGIMNNFNIKYTTVKNEIDAKFNNLLKLFLNDIQPFLDNLEEISKERKKLKDFENIQREYNIMSLKLKEKISNEHRLESNIESLQREINQLKNENNIIRNSSKRLIEFKTPSNAQNKPVKSIFGRKAHLKMKSEVININLDNKINLNNKKNTRNNKTTKTSVNKKKSKKFINERNNFSPNIKFKESIVYDKKIPLPSTLTTSKSNTNQNIIMDKTIEKLRQYNENRNNLKIKKLTQFKVVRTKFKNKVKTHNNNYIGLKKNVNNMNKKKKNVNKLDRNKTFGPDIIGKYNNITETNPAEDSKNINNYSEDDENKSNNIKSNSSRSSSRSKSSKSSNSSKSKSKSRSSSVGSGSFRSDITSIENEIKELEEDENNIILLMKQIKEFSSNVE